MAFEKIEHRKNELVSILGGYVEYTAQKGLPERTKELESYIAQVKSGRYQIVIMGYLKRGKSTLLNALLGRSDLSPVRPNPCTAAVVKYLDKSYNPQGNRAAGVFIHDNQGVRSAAKEDLKRYVDQGDTSFKGEEAAKNIECVEIYDTFPLIGDRAVMVDTPGMGAIFDQDYIALNILPESDAVIMPIAATLPLENSECQFLKQLPCDENKVVFVLTMKDAADSSDALKRTTADIKEKLGKAGFLSPRLFPVSAREVVKAYKNSPADIDSVKRTSGMASLETYLEDHLPGSSFVDEKIRTVAGVLERYLREEKHNLEELKKDVTLTENDLQKRKKELAELYKNVKASLDRQSKLFKGKWKNEVEQFCSKIEQKQNDICRRLESQTVKESLLSLVKYPQRMQRKISLLLQEELAPELVDLGENLNGLCQKFLEDFNDEVRVYYQSTSGGMDIKDEMDILLGVGISLGGTIGGGAAVLGAIGSVGTAAAALGAATVEAGTFFGWLGGVFGTGGVVAAKAGLAAALGASVAPLLLGGSVVYLGMKLGTKYAQESAKKKIPELVEKQIIPLKGAIVESTNKTLNNYLANLTLSFDETMQKHAGELEEIQNAIKQNNAAAELEKIQKDMDRINGLSSRLLQFNNIIGAA
jgi:hypothetical protein